MASFTMRIQPEQYEALRAMSILTGEPMSELVRRAIREHLGRIASQLDPGSLTSQRAVELKAAAETLAAYRSAL